MKDFLPIFIQKPRSTIRHDTPSLTSPNLGTQISLGRHTKHTLRLTTLRRVTRNNMISRHDTRHTLTHALHNAPRLMTQNTRKQPLRIMTIQRIHIRMTQRVRHHLHPHFPTPRGQHLDSLHHQRLLRTTRHRGTTFNYLTHRPRKIVFYGGVPGVELPIQPRRVKGHVRFDKCRNEMIRVVESVTALHHHVLSALCRRCFQILRF
mmetsp:Transcript_61145/g.72591  ORF Transcript_61145/g.72591 Transcript_61145/m.72591 type:complete len:206 (-) Transcript_61145:109-726(-)